jgi:hypothetical protein
LAAACSARWPSSDVAGIDAGELQRLDRTARVFHVRV